MKRGVAAAVVAGALLGGVGLIDVAGAAEPAEQACVGEFLSGGAHFFGGRAVGAGISGMAKDPGAFGLASWGEFIQDVQAGLVPDEVFDNNCNN